MKKGIAYFLVVIATACEYMARYLVKGEAQTAAKGRRIPVKHVADDHQDDFEDSRWVH